MLSLEKFIEMNKPQLKSKWDQQAQEWRKRMKATGDTPHAVPMPDGSTVVPQVYIVSMPKSGRTWLRVLIGKALIENFGLNSEDLLEPLKLTVSANLLPTEFIHDGTNIALGKHWSELEADKSPYKDKKVIFLIREPKDLIVSSYFSAASRKKIYDRSISEFIRSDKYGIKKIMTFYKIWSDRQTVPKDFLLLRYKDLQENCETSLESVLKFIGVENIPQQTIANAVHFASFENMKKLERSENYNWRLSSPNPDDEESYKVRKGKIGGYVDYLSEQDIQYIDRVVSETGTSFF